MITHVKEDRRAAVEPGQFEHFSPELLEKVARLELKARMVAEGVLSGMHKSPYRGFNVEFLEHREYYPGDDIRHVDWKLFGKRDKFFIKQFEEDTNLRAYILLDSSASMRFGDGAHGSKLQYASLLAASLAYLFIKQGDAAGLVTFDDKVLYQVEPHAGRAHLYRVLAALERNTQGGATDLAGALSRFGESLKRRSFVILISDLLTEPEPVMAALKTLRGRQSEMALFHLLDRAEVDLPYKRASRFVDMETGAAVAADPAAIRAAYRRNLEKHVDAFRAFCRVQTIDFIHAVTDTPVDKTLLGCLQQREQRKRGVLHGRGRGG